MSPPITFVTCVESGPLESQVLRMVESLRRFGGAFANCPLWAIKPRFGPPVSRHMRREFDRLGVEYQRTNRTDPHDWYAYINKTRALTLAEEQAPTEFVGWLDADLLFTGEPSEVTPGPDQDISACSSDNCGGTSGPDDKCEPFWREAGAACGVAIEQLPWVTTEREGDRIRLYWNSGVFVFRRGTGLAAEHDRCTRRLLDVNLGSSVTGVFFTEQYGLALAAAKLGLRRRQLPHSHNYEMGSAIHQQWYREEKLRAARIVHYHDCMWPAFWPTFLGCLRTTHPDVANWLEPLGPLKNVAPLAYRAVTKFLKKRRARGEVRFKAECRFV
ncbi:MAG TPA: hypothetical protein VKD71_11420 [Gemmataceae bacterium]|nr:hypothetical protein [Gemmataceae bacterium]